MISPKGSLFVLLLVAVACVAGSASAQSSGGSYRLDSAVIAAGGGTATGGDFRLSGTIGQSAATTLSASSYVLYDGFWAPPANSAGDAIFANGFDS